MLAPPAAAARAVEGPRAMAPRIVEVTTPAPQCGISVEQMRALLAERRTSTASEGETPTRPSPATAESLAAVERIEAAARDGTWTSDDRDLLRRSLGELDPAQAESVLASLSKAVNEGRLRPDAHLM
jgi:hypothetical protein